MPIISRFLGGGLHGLQTYSANPWLEPGENLTCIQSQPEQASPTVTLNVSDHLIKPANQEAACRLEIAIL